MQRWEGWELVESRGLVRVDIDPAAVRRTASKLPREVRGHDSAAAAAATYTLHKLAAVCVCVSVYMTQQLYIYTHPAYTSASLSLSLSLCLLAAVSLLLLCMTLGGSLENSCRRTYSYILGVCLEVLE